MTFKKAVILVSVLAFFAIGVPAFVISRTISLNAGWNGIPWGSTESQVQTWVKKNNNRVSWAKCTASHYGVTCFKITWKESEKSPFECIEFQFQNGELKAVIETAHQKDFERSDLTSLGKASYGTDLATDIEREKGIKYRITDRVFYYDNLRKYSSVKKRAALELLVRTPINADDVPEKILCSRLTTAYYSSDYYEMVKSSSGDFPAQRFIKQ